MQDLAIAGVLIIPVVVGVTEKFKAWFGWTGRTSEMFAWCFGFTLAVIAGLMQDGLLSEPVVMGVRIVFSALAFVVAPQGLYDYFKSAGGA